MVAWVLALVLINRQNNFLVKHGGFLLTDNILIIKGFLYVSLKDKNIFLSRPRRSKN